ncbi:uncharacterized protein TNCV_692351 [Trichonephila clavipes]|nr:uncharacterized protein TNCV_692351 [Trichonephila clavipes]
MTSFGATKICDRASDGHHNQLIQLIKRVSPRLQNDNYQIVIKADKVPLGEHAGRFNAPTVDEVAVIMVEWQKRGLPHAHILVWLKDRIRPEEIDQIISAESPDPLIDQELFDIVTKHMIHGPCGAFNMTSPCMENGKCKNFPKPHTNDTITDIDGYQSIAAEVLIMVATHLQCDCRTFPNQVEFDNEWVVPYSPLLSKLTKLISMLGFGSY